MDQMKWYVVPVRVLMRGESWVEAASADEAADEVERGKGDFHVYQAEMVDWTIIGKFKEAPK